MRVIILFILSVALQNSFAQQDEAAGGKSQNENLKELSNSIFIYPEFANGAIFLKDGSVVNKKLNYNRVIGKLFFLDRQGQSRIFADTDNIRQVIIASDTFFFYKSNFLRILTHHPNINLCVSQKIDYVNDTKNGTGSIIIVADASRITSRNNDPKKEELDKNSSFKLTNTYFICDTTGEVYPASKRSFNDLFPSHENELKKYFRSHNVSFTNADDIEKLLIYMQSF
jgi:hypothetical protein